MPEETETRTSSDLAESELSGQEAALMSIPELEHYREIIRLNKEVKYKQFKYEAAKAEAKLCKEELDCASMDLSTLIADGPQKPDPQMELPFDASGSDGAAGKFDWESTPVTEALKLSPKQRDKLDELGIKTVGQLEFIRAGRDPMYPDGLRSIKGFGQKTIDAFENDITNWLFANTREKEPSSDDATGE